MIYLWACLWLSMRYFRVTAEALSNVFRGSSSNLFKLGKLNSSTNLMPENISTNLQNILHSIFKGILKIDLVLGSVLPLLTGFFFYFGSIKYFSQSKFTVILNSSPLKNYKFIFGLNPSTPPFPFFNYTNFFLGALPPNFVI